MQNYFYRDNAGKEIGPLNLSTLAQLRMAGALNDDTPVRSENSADWISLQVILPSIPVQQTSQISLKKSVNWTWAGLLAAVAIILIASHFQHPTETIKKGSGNSEMDANECINNLRQLDAVANQFALEHRKRTGDYINFPSDLTPYIKLTADGKIPGCPMGGIYNISRVGDTPTCSLGNKVKPHHILGEIPDMTPSQACNACINYLRQIDAAANQFALEHRKRTGDYINFPSDLTPYIKLTADGKIPGCPAGGVYSISRVGDMPTCSLGNTVTPNHILP